MPRSQLTEQYQRVMSLVEQLHALAEDERNFILDLLVPLPEQVETRKATKKSARKSNKSASKSARGQSLSNAIQRTAKVMVDDSDDEDPNEHCQKEFAGGFVCNEPADANVHHLRGATGYHEFDAGKSSVSTAPPARGKSLTNGGAKSSTASSEIDSENVSNAVHAASGE